MTEDVKDPTAVETAAPDMPPADAPVAETAAADAAATSAVPPGAIDRVTDEIVTALKTGNDPENPADNYENGEIYKVDLEDDR
jgi:hypothetical protein